MTILITGANRGIGAALLNTYATRGDQVIGTARTDTESLLPLDVAQPEAFDALSARLQGQAIDVLVCNAGVYLDKGHAMDTGYAPHLWAQTFAVNVTGVFLTVKHLLPNLKRAKAPKIAIISSKMASTTEADGGAYIYRSSKAAVLNLGRNLATDLAVQNIAVGIYHPGWVRTDMGSSAADISSEQAAQGLIQRFDTLSLATTGCFETWDGKPYAY